MEEWKREAERLYKKHGRDWSGIADEMMPMFPNLSHFEVKEKVRRYIRDTPLIKQTNTDDSQKSSMEYKADGTVVSTKFITLRDGEEMSPLDILKAHGMDPLKWEIVNYISNFWNSQLKGGTLQTSYQTKLTAKPRGESITFADIDDYFKNKTFSHTKPSTKPLNYDPNGEVLEVDLPDLHSGLLAWRKETGADYDVHIAEERFCECISDVVYRCRHRQFKKIYLVTLGDVLNFDNDNQTTTKGTFQQADGRLAKIFDATLDMLIDGITILSLIAPVEVIYLPGNHDRVTGYTLLKATEKAFRRDENVNFDTEPNPQKYRLIGKALVGWTHGDMQKQNMANWLQHEARAEYGQSKYAEVHAGHFHSQNTKEAKRDFTQMDEIGGVVVRYLPTISSASYWEHQQGYTSAIRSMMAFVWNEETGLRDMWYSNIA